MIMRQSCHLLIFATCLTLMGLSTSNPALGQTTQSPSTKMPSCDDFVRLRRPTLKRRGETTSSRPTAVEEQVIVKCKNPEDGQVQTLIGLGFVGLKAFHESDVIKFLSEAGVGLRPDRMPDEETAGKAAKALKKLLATKGYVYSDVTAIRDEQFSSVTFQVTEGERLQLADIRFEGSKVFSADALNAITRGCLSKFRKSDDAFEQELLEYCLRRAANFVRSQGYLEAKFGEPKNEILGNRIVPTVKVDEGSLYRLGEIRIQGADHLAAEYIREMLPLRQGEVAKADSISKWLFEDLKERYADLGYIEYTAEPVPDFRKVSEVEGIVNFKVIIEEGDRFTLRSIELEGEQLPTARFVNESPLRPGDIYNDSKFAAFVNQLNQTGLFEPIDKDKDSDFRVNHEERLVSIHLKLRKRGRP